jgi:hypothetical protein
MQHEHREDVVADDGPVEGERIDAELQKRLDACDPDAFRELYGRVGPFFRRHLPELAATLERVNELKLASWQASTPERAAVLQRKAAAQLMGGAHALRGSVNARRLREPTTTVVARPRERRSRSARTTRAGPKDGEPHPEPDGLDLVGPRSS